MVVGAGRGPLVQSAMQAADNTGRNIKLIVVEKNPNAIVTLMALLEERWSDKGKSMLSRHRCQWFSIQLFIFQMLQLFQPT